MNAAALLKPTDDSLCALYFMECIQCVFVARQSGIILKINLTNQSLEIALKFPQSPRKFCISLDLVKLALLTETSELQVYDINGLLTKNSANKNLKEVQETKKVFEHKDVWDVLWASDDPDMFAFVEKARLRVVKNGVMGCIFVKNTIISSLLFRGSDCFFWISCVFIEF